MQQSSGPQTRSNCQMLRSQKTNTLRCVSAADHLVRTSGQSKAVYALQAGGRRGGTQSADRCDHMCNQI